MSEKKGRKGEWENSQPHQRHGLVTTLVRCHTLRSMGDIPNEVWVGPKPKNLAFSPYSSCDDLGNYTASPTGAKMVKKGFQTHGKQLKYTRDIVLTFIYTQLK